MVRRQANSRESELDVVRPVASGERWSLQVVRERGRMEAQLLRWPRRYDSGSN